MDYEIVKKYVDLLKEEELTVIEIVDGDKKVRIEKANLNGNVYQTMQPNNAYVSDAGRAVEQKNEVSGEQVKSPLVGTFYLTPSPDQAVFVKEGQQVSQGDVLCIVEAMKVMNEIVSPVSGTVKKIAAQTGDVVEFGQVLFVIE